MEHLARLMDTHPAPASDHGEEALALVRAAADCMATCEACADACLAEEDPAGMRDCIRLNLDCAEVCAVTARVVARTGHRDRSTLDALLSACAAACRACGDECEEHASEMEHCRVCAEACRRCEEACERMQGALVA